MDPKKIVILVLLLVGLVFAGRWACKKWEYYHPKPVPYQSLMGGGYGMGKAGKAGKAPGAPGQAPVAPAPAGR